MTPPTDLVAGCALSTRTRSSSGTKRFRVFPDLDAIVDVTQEDASKPHAGSQRGVQQPWQMLRSLLAAAADASKFVSSRGRCFEVC
mmetsp:Transcript_8490/g.21895  ORF Transcript_8490/g.21895 Transcript_8490/m.21895 type:complete len:86 (-) Transcript_8490:11-268(-)